MGQVQESEHPKHVVLDSNVLVADFQRSGMAFHTFLNALERTDYHLYVPEIVIDEVVNKFGEAIEAGRRKVEDGVRALNRCTGQPFRVPLSVRRAESLVIQYEEELRDQLESVGANILPYPDVPHSTLVARALKRRKPFSDSGSGYRDALIWETVVDLAAQLCEPVAFITGNAKDFCDDSSGGLHQDLHPDLQTWDIDICNVQPVARLADFVDAHILPKIQVLDAKRHQLATEAFPGLSFAKNAREKLAEYLQGVSCPPGAVGLAPEFEEVVLHEIEEIGDVEVADVREFSPDELLVRARAAVRCVLVFYVQKSFYYTMRTGDAPLLWNADYDEHRVGAYAVKQLLFDYWLSIEEESRDVRFLSIENVDVVDVDSDPS